MQMINCPHCSATNSLDATYCKICGTQLSLCPADQPLTNSTDSKHPVNGFGIVGIVLGILGVIEPLIFALVISGSSSVARHLLLASSHYIIHVAVFSVLPLLGLIFGCVSKDRSYRNDTLILAVISLVLMLSPVIIDTVL